MIIKNGIVADPASGLYEQMDILVKDGKIVKIAPDISCASDAAATEKEEIIDASGMIVGPGLIDTHVHFRDPGFTYKEDIHTGSLAAAKGGFTTVVCMANTKPTVDNVDTLKDNLTRGKQAQIRMYQAAAISHSLKGQDEVRSIQPGIRDPWTGKTNVEYPSNDEDASTIHKMTTFGICVLDPTRTMSIIPAILQG